MFIFNFLKNNPLKIFVIIFILSISSCGILSGKSERLPKVNEPYTFTVIAKYQENGNNYLFGDDRKINVTLDTFNTNNVGSTVSFDNYVKTKQGYYLDTAIIILFIICIVCFVLSIRLIAIREDS